jgi:ABC-type multidrug transport system fused ATPase/permease subunit
VDQESVLFVTTLKENIIYGKSGATLEEIKMVAELAKISNCLRVFIQWLVKMCVKFPHILETSGNAPVSRHM